MGVRIALKTTDLMNPKQYGSAKAMLADVSRVHQLAIMHCGARIDAGLARDLRHWHDAWLLLSIVRSLRLRPKVDFPVFLRGVKVRLPGHGASRYGYRNDAGVMSYVATSRPYLFDGYAVVFRITDDLRVVEVEHVW